MTDTADRSDNPAEPIQDDQPPAPEETPEEPLVEPL